MGIRIEIAGGIAAGKSTLCNALVAAGIPVISENLAENPYLKRQYNNPASRGFDVQMAFLLSKFSAIETQNTAAPVVVCDYAAVTEYAYNDVHLKNHSEEAWKICKDTIDLKRAQVGDPDILILLDCPADEQLRRIKSRGRDFEQGLTKSYLDNLNTKIRNYCAAATGPQCLKLVFNSADIDVGDPVFIKNLLAQFAATLSKKQSSRPPRPRF